MKRMWIVVGLMILVVGISSCLLLINQKKEKSGGKKDLDQENIVENNNSTDVSNKENDLSTEKDKSETNSQENEQTIEEENQNLEIPIGTENTAVSNTEQFISNSLVQETPSSSSSTSNTVVGGQEQQPNISPDNSNQASTPTQQVTTTFYDSITKGKREFSSENAAFTEGNIIMQRELDYVMNYNELHPENPIQPDINYFRVYPSVVDENGNYWYYLHFFCQSGEGNDEKLKSLYGTTKN